jgi:predicted secreted hydrolase
MSARFLCGFFNGVKCRESSVWLLALVVLTGCSEPQKPASFFGDMRPSAQHASVDEGKPILLPYDHKSHPEYQLEWWYLTFVLQDNNGNDYGLQYTLFRFLRDDIARNDWSNNQQWMGHASLHTIDNHFFEERFAQGNVGNAFVTAEPFEAVIDDWSWTSTSNALFPSNVSVTIQPSVKVALALTQTGPFIKHGNNGYSKKTHNASLRSYYYSQPHIEVAGNIEIEGQSVAVSGKGWFDHEWTSHLANNSALGWDWFSLHLDDGSKLMAFQMHALPSSALGEEQDRSDTFTTGTYISQNGQSQTLNQDDIQLSVLATERINEKSVPTRWTLSIPAKHIDITISPFKPNQWNDSVFPYYEGRVNVTGSHSGSGFLELTGY